MNEYIGIILINIGILFNLVSCLGLVRLPDVYTRLQSSTKAVTMGSSLALIGIAVFTGMFSVAAQSLLTILFIFVSAPTAAHAIARGAHSSGIRVERITAEGLIGRTIEYELLDVVRVGEKFKKDRFDHTLETCPIFEIEEPIDDEELLERVSKVLAPRLKMRPRELERMLLERENEATTALAPEVAFPHVIVEGQNMFEMLVVRAREGVRFSEEQSHVHAIFVLVGTQDQWHFYLRSMAALATMVREDDFLEQWKQAEDEEELHKILLERSRRRHLTD